MNFATLYYLSRHKDVVSPLTRSSPLLTVQRNGGRIVVLSFGRKFGRPACLLGIPQYTVERKENRLSICEGKVKCTLGKATTYQRGSRGIALLFL
jgi:hypothetical protein